MNRRVDSDWRLAGMKSLPDADGRKFIEFQAFDFRARVPVKEIITNRANGQEIFEDRTESIMLSLQRFNFPENEPSLIGTLKTPIKDETIFFVLTVRPFK